MLRQTELELVKTLEKKPTKVQWEGVITAIQENILKKLAHYKYLTIEQLLRFEDIGTTQYSYLWRQIKSLRDRKKALVGCNSFPNPNPRKGKVHSIYYLNTSGRDTLINEFGYYEEDIRYKVGKHLTVSQYQHRLYTVEYQMYLDDWAERNEVDIKDFHAYYDTQGSNRKAKSLRSLTKVDLAKGKSFTPDAVYRVENEKRENELHLFELYNGKDTKYIVKQLHQHAEAMAFGQVHEKYQVPVEKSYKVIVLFTHKGALEGTIKKALIDPVFAHFYKHFICKELESDSFRVDSLFENWVNLYGEVESFY